MSVLIVKDVYGVLFSDGDPNLANQSLKSSRSSRSGSGLDSMNSSGAVSEELMATMDTLMQSLTSGDFSSVDPAQFYSLLDTLQGLDGLNPTDLQQLEHSYSQYLKVAESIGSSSLNSLNSNSSGIAIPSNNHMSHMHQSISPHMSPRMSPRLSPSTSPLSHSPLSHSPHMIETNFPSQIGSGSLQMGLVVANPYTSPNISPNHSPVGSPIMRHGLVSSGSISSSGSHLSPNRMQGHAPSQSLQSQLSAFANSPTAHDQQFLQDPTEQQYLQSARNSDLLYEEDEDEFDWSSLL